MKLSEVYDFIDSFAPFSTQSDFDNAGFLVGNPDEELKCAVVTLDVTSDAIEKAVSLGANLIITHHPVIFDGLKTVLADSLVHRLIKSGISVISAHTNLDMAAGGVNDRLCEELGFENFCGIIPEGEVFAARLASLEGDITADELGALIEMNLRPASIKYVGRQGLIKRVAVCSGSGGSLLREVVAAGADAFITADVKHDVFLEAARLNLALYDCGHFDTEDIVIAPLTERLNEKFGNLFFEHHSAIIKTVVPEI